MGNNSIRTIFLILLLFFASCIGHLDGFKNGEFETREKVVVYCISKPYQCKNEYNFIIQKQKAQEFKRPVIEDTETTHSFKLHNPFSKT